MTKTLDLTQTFTTTVTNAAIEKILGKVSTVRDDIQTTAVILLIDSYHTGDLGQVNKFILGLKGLNATNTNSLIEWYILCGFQIDDKNLFVKRDTKVIEQAFAGKLIKIVNKKEQKIHPVSFKWWMAKVEPPFKGLDLTKALEQLLNRADKAQEKVNAMHKGKARDEAQALIQVTDEQRQALHAIINAA